MRALRLLSSLNWSRWKTKVKECIPGYGAWDSRKAGRKIGSEEEAVIYMKRTNKREVRGKSKTDESFADTADVKRWMWEDVSLQVEDKVIQ